MALWKAPQIVTISIRQKLKVQKQMMAIWRSQYKKVQKNKKYYLDHLLLKAKLLIHMQNEIFKKKKSKQQNPYIHLDS